MNFSFGEHLLHEREIAEQLQARQSSQLHKYSRFHHKRESKQTHARTTIQGHTGPTTHGATQYTPRARYRKALACTHHTTRVITVQERHSRRLNSLLPPSKCTVRTKDAGSSYALLASKAWNTSVRVTIPACQKKTWLCMCTELCAVFCSHWDFMHLRLPVGIREWEQVKSDS